METVPYYTVILMFCAGLFLGGGGVKPNLSTKDRKAMVLLGVGLAVIAIINLLWLK